MRVVFMGTPDFAVPSLEALDATFDVVGVVTRPDAVRGRGKTLDPSPVKACAARLGLPVREATRMDDETQAWLRGLEPDILCVAAFGCILPQGVIDLAPLGCVNVHASLLPRWRGAAPIQRAILAGDRTAGVSIMRVVKELDAGDFCLTGSVPIDGKNSAQVTDELSHPGARLLVRALVAVEAGEAVWTPQDESLVTFAPKVEKAEMRLDPGDTAVANVRRVLASSDAAPARLRAGGRGMRVLAARTVAGLGARPGHLRIEHGRVALGCSDGVVELLEVKPDGKRAMAAGEWARGLHDDPDCRWERI